MKRIKQELEALEVHAMKRELKVLDSPQEPWVTLNGQRLLLLCSNNYLGLANHPQLKEAAIRATEQYGTGSGASRLVSGTQRLHADVERQLAHFKQTEGALLFNSGFAANTALLPALAAEGDLVFSDALNHASIVDGCRLSRARTLIYPHNDIKRLEQMMAEESVKRSSGRWLIVTDGIFSMDGDLAPLQQLTHLKQEYDAWLVVDDAHATGILGENGRGTGEHLGCHEAIDVQMGTLGKGLGGFGAFVCARQSVLDFLVNRARPFIFSTSLPPAVLGAASAAIDLVQGEDGRQRRHQLARNTHTFTQPLREAGLDLGDSATQIVPILMGAPAPTMQAAEALIEQGLFLQGIRPPTVPAGTCRLRTTLMADHSPDDLHRAAQAIVACLRNENAC